MARAVRVEDGAEVVGHILRVRLDRELHEVEDSSQFDYRATTNT